MDSVLEKWLSDFGPSTANTYFYALQKFKKNLGIDDLGEYLESKPNVLTDFKTFAQSLKGKPPKTISTYTGAVKVFYPTMISTFHQKIYGSFGVAILYRKEQGRSLLTKYQLRLS